MNKKQLRILVFDREHFRGFYIEKMLNRLGYYQVAPMTRWQEFVAAIENSIVPVNLVCCNASDWFAHDDILFFFRNKNLIENLIFYNEPQAIPDEGIPPFNSEGGGGFSLLPDLFALSSHMEVIEFKLLKA